MTVNFNFPGVNGQKMGLKTRFEEHPFSAFLNEEIEEFNVQFFYAIFSCVPQKSRGGNQAHSWKMNESVSHHQSISDKIFVQFFVLF